MEEYVATHGSSVWGAASVPFDSRWLRADVLRETHTRDNLAPLVAAGDLRALAGGRDSFVYQKSEGSFYPWRAVTAAIAALRARGPLDRLNAQVGWPEETYLPTFARDFLGAACPLAADNATLGAGVTRGRLLCATATSRVAVRMGGTGVEQTGRRAPPRVVAMEERMASRLAARENRFASKIGGLAHRDCAEDTVGRRARRGGAKFSS